MFSLNDIALFNGNNQVTFTFSPEDIIALENEIATVADSITFGLMRLTDDEMKSVEEFFEGVDPSFTLEAIPSNIVSSPVVRVYTLTANENVFWNASNVKFNGTASATETEDDDSRNELDISIETVRESEDIPSNYGNTVYITVSSIAGYTRKGEFEITVQKSVDNDNDDEWEDADVLKFDSSQDESDITGISSSSSGCNSGLTLFALGLALSVIIFKRKVL